MRVYIGLVSRAGPLAPQLLEAVRQAGTTAAIPSPQAHAPVQEWISPSGNVALLAWSNEPAIGTLPEPMYFAASGRVLGYAGHLADPPVDEQKLLNTDRLGETVEHMGGCFSVFRADDNGLEAATAISRVNPVYYAETSDAVAAGNRALLVHLAVRASHSETVRPSVAYDVMALHPMVRHGFFTNDETPFMGVKALPAATVLTASGTDLKIVKGLIPTAGPEPLSRRETKNRTDALAEALIEAAKPLARHGEPVTLALSGGRDSRLMAAVLSASGVPLQARTHGFADDPDVTLAAQIAAALGIEHRIDHTQAPESDSIAVQHPFLRAHHVLRACEGMMSAYERASDWMPFQTAPETSGSGGEMLRGGFLYDQLDLTPKALQARVRKLFHSAEAFVTPEARTRAELDHRPWAELAHSNGLDALDKLYLHYRSGRWIVGSHNIALMNSSYYPPFHDNRVVRAALALPASVRASETVVFQLIKTLSPALVAIPPEGKRWRFERERPRSLTDYPGWRRRTPPKPSGRTSGYNWRKHYTDDFLKLLRDQVESAPPELFNVVDKKRCNEQFAEVPTSWHPQTWHIFTLGVLLSNAWLETSPDLPTVTIPIPPAAI